MASNICSSCKIDTEIVVDHSEPSVLCSRCGSILKTNPFDEIPKLRNSASVVENSNEVESSTSPTSSSNSNDPKMVKNMSRGSIIIEAMADGLGLTTEIRDRTQAIYNEVDVLRSCRGRSLNLIAAACIYLACKETGLPRTLSEISAVGGEGVSKKHINRTAESIKRQLDVESWTVHPEEYVRGYCSRIGLGEFAVKAVQEAVLRAQEMVIRRSPKSVLSAIMYMVIQLSSSQEKPPLPVKDIANAMEVTELTIKKSFIDVSVHASKVIPDWYASEEEVKNIPTP